MDVELYFQVIRWILMVLALMALVFIFLHMLYGKEEET